VHIHLTGSQPPWPGSWPRHLSWRPKLEELFLMSCTYSPSPSGRGRGEGHAEPRRALAVPRVPYTDVKTAIVVLHRAAARHPWPYHWWGRLDRLNTPQWQHRHTRCPLCIGLGSAHQIVYVLLHFPAHDIRSVRRTAHFLQVISAQGGPFL
jgi:hypothetical protein